MSSLRQDLISISKLPEENFADIVEMVTHNSRSSIDWAAYLESLDEDTKAQSISLYRLLNYIGDAFSDARDFEKEASELDGFISPLAESNPEAKVGWERIKSSYTNLNTFFLHKKEETIKSRFSSVSGSSITVDARPIFSMDRETIDKVVFPYILKIETCDEKTFVCELYPDQLELLEEEIECAKQKRLKLEKRLGADD